MSSSSCHEVRGYGVGGISLRSSSSCHHHLFTLALPSLPLHVIVMSSSCQSSRHHHVITMEWVGGYGVRGCIIMSSSCQVIMSSSCHHGVGGSEGEWEVYYIHVIIVFIMSSSCHHHGMIGYGVRGYGVRGYDDHVMMTWWWWHDEVGGKESEWEGRNSLMMTWWWHDGNIPSHSLHSLSLHSLSLHGDGDMMMTW